MLSKGHTYRISFGAALPYFPCKDRLIPAVLMEVENNTMSGLKRVIAIKEGKTNLSPRSLSSFQSAVRCNNPECTLFVYFENFAPALTNLMELLLWALIHFLDDRNGSRATTRTLKTES